MFANSSLQAHHTTQNAEFAWMIAVMLDDGHIESQVAA
jgi:hypothetical protein